MMWSPSPQINVPILDSILCLLCNLVIFFWKFTDISFFFFPPHLPVINSPQRPRHHSTILAILKLQSRASQRHHHTVFITITTPSLLPLHLASSPSLHHHYRYTHHRHCHYTLIISFTTPSSPPAPSRSPMQMSFSKQALGPRCQA